MHARKSLALVVSGLVGTAGVVSLAAAGTAPQPALRLVATSPLAVAGTGFGAYERVLVTASSGGRQTRVTRSTSRGGFVARFDARFDRCSGLLVRAVGATGRRASLKLPQPLCPPVP